MPGSVLCSLIGRIRYKDNTDKNATKMAAAAEQPPALAPGLSRKLKKVHITIFRAILRGGLGMLFCHFARACRQF